MKKNLVFVIGSLLALSIILGGCGRANLLSGLAGSGTTSGSGSNDTASIYLDNGDYNSAITEASSVISGNYSADEIREAYALRGEARLGLANVKAASIISSLTNTANASSSGNLNLLNSIVQNVATADITNAADDLLRALTSNMTLKQSNFQPQATFDLSNLSDRQFLAGLACALAASKLVVNKFDTDDDKKLEAAVDFADPDLPRSNDWASCTSVSGVHVRQYILKATEYLSAAISNNDFTVTDTVNQVKAKIDIIDSSSNSNLLTNAVLVTNIF